MALTFGFYNSENGDRRHDAKTMSELFNGIIADGVFMSIGTSFEVRPTGGMGITVGTGRAWFNSTWTNNDALIPLTVSEAESILPRIDAVILELDASHAVRANTIKIKTGTPSMSPVGPDMDSTATFHQHPLAWIHVRPGTTSIAMADITNLVGTSLCPFVTAPTIASNIDSLYTQWEDQFNTWFAGVEAVLDGNVVLNLQNQINQNKYAIEDVHAIYSLISKADAEAGVQSSLSGWSAERVREAAIASMFGVFKSTHRMYRIPLTDPIDVDTVVPAGLTFEIRTSTSTAPSQIKVISSYTTTGDPNLRSVYVLLPINEPAYLMMTHSLEEHALGYEYYLVDRYAKTIDTNASSSIDDLVVFRPANEETDSYFTSVNFTKFAPCLKSGSRNMLYRLCGAGGGGFAHGGGGGALMCGVVTLAERSRITVTIGAGGRWGTSSQTAAVGGGSSATWLNSTTGASSTLASVGGGGAGQSAIGSGSTTFTGVGSGARGGNGGDGGPSAYTTNGADGGTVNIASTGVFYAGGGGGGQYRSGTDSTRGRGGLNGGGGGYAGSGSTAGAAAETAPGLIPGVNGRTGTGQYAGGNGGSGAGGGCGAQQGGKGGDGYFRVALTTAAALA